MPLPPAARLPLSLLLLTTAACGAGEPPNVAVPPIPPVVAPPSATAAPTAPPDDPQAHLNALVCGRRDPCAILKQHDAGKDAAGRSVSAVLVFTGHESFGEEATEEPPGPPEAGVTFEPDGETFGAESMGSCARYEYWRILRDGEGGLEADRIAEICNDGHGAAGVGEDAVKIGANSITIATSGGSNWRWGETSTSTLSPFVRTSQSSSGDWAVSNNRDERQIDWQTFSGSTRWYSPPCDTDGNAPENEGGNGVEYEEIWIPSLPLAPAFLSEGWKTTRLDRCAASIDAGGGGGYVLSGKASNAADAHVRVVASDSGTLFIEVVDDTVVSEDHLEIWVASSRPSFDQHCIDATDTSGVHSWNVRVTDGKVSPGFGKPPVTSLPVERAAVPSGAVRFRVVLPAAPRSVTVAYADSDSGKKIERRIATSRLDGAHLATLGRLTPAGDQAICTLKDGALTPEMKPQPLNNP